MKLVQCSEYLVSSVDTGCSAEYAPIFFSIIYGLIWFTTLVPEAGGRLNKKDGLTRYGNSHVKDKTS